MKIPIYTLLLVGLAGCSIVDHKRAEFEDGEGADFDSSTDPTTDGEESGQPVPTTGGWTGLATSTSNADTDTDTDTDTTGGMPAEDPPTVDHFAVRSEVDEAGPLWINATVSGAAETELEILRDGELFDTIKNPKFPRDIPITSGSFDGNYTFILHAWSSNGLSASATKTSVVDLPEGGTLQASWQDMGDSPSSAAAIVPVQAGNLAGEDGVLAALGINGKLRLYRFDTDLQLQAPVQAWCGEGSCHWEPAGMVVDTQNPDHVYVVGNGDDGARLMKFDVNGQPMWPEAVKLDTGHASGVAYEAEFDRVFVSGWAEYSVDDVEWSNSKMWIVQAGEAVAQLEYESTYEWQGQPRTAKNRAHGVTLSDTGRVLLVGETMISPLDADEGFTRGNIIEFDNFALTEKFHVPTWGDDSARSGFQGVASDKNGGFVAAGWYQGDGSPRGYFISFDNQLQPEGQHSSPTEPEGVHNAVALHPERHLVVAGVQEPTASAFSPTLWASRYVSGAAFSRARAITIDRYGRVFLAGEKSVNGQLRATVELLRP